MTPRNDRIRPTSDRIKESLFNILGTLLGNLEGVRILDLFAGTGNLGIEALSRGGNEAVFVEENRDAAILIKKNLELCGFAEKGRIMQKEAVSALKLLEKSGASFGLALMDPPYDKGLSGQVLDLLAVSGLVEASSIVVAETSAREQLAARFGRLHEFDRRVYGDTALTFFRLVN